jgi:small subunit ribosomal protein S23
MSNARAYDIARKEFYELRHEEAVERRVTREEALWSGAYFGKSALEVGMELEDKTYAYTGLGSSSEDEVADVKSDSAEVTVLS